MEWRFSPSSYLVTTFKIVPRGTEGAVSIEGTLAGLAASIFLAYFGCLLGLVRNCNMLFVELFQDDFFYQFLCVA